MNECIFCSIISGSSPASFVYQDELAVAFMDIQPITPGHVLVIPRQHYSNLSELDPSMGGHLFRVAQHLADALYKSGLRCEGINFHLADGEVAGQEVFHVHLHVLPRFLGDGFGFKFPPGYRTRPPRSELERVVEIIKTAISD